MDFEISYIPDENKDQSNASSIPRILGGAALRGAEGALGSAGNILKTIGDIGVSAFNKVAPAPVPEFFSPLPTSAQLRKGTEYLTGEIFNPKSTSEKYLQNVIQDVGELASPILGFTGLGMKAGKALKLSLGSNLASGLVEAAGGGEGAQVAAKVGTIFGISLYGLRPELEKIMRDSYATGRELGQTIKIDARPLEKTARQIEREIGRGIETPSKAALAKPIEQIQTATATGTLTASEAWQIKQDINEIMRSGKTPSRALGSLGKLRTELDTILSTTAKESPEFGKLYKSSEGLYKALNVENAIEKTMNRFFSSKLGKIPRLVGVKRLADFSYLALKSPEAARHYAQTIKAASEENFPAIAKHLTALKKMEDVDDGDFEITSLGQ